MLSVSEYRGVAPKVYESEHLKRSSDELASYLVVHPGDLVLNTMWLNHRGLGVSQFDGVVSPAYRVYQLTSIQTSFAHHLLRSSPYVNEYTRLAYGIRPNSLQVSAKDFGSLPLPLPNKREQHAIASYLDRKTAAIDDLIAKKERLIELLEEKRQAVIARVVTRGTNASVSLRPAGISGIGELPAHWSVLPLKRISPRISGRLVYQPAQYFADEGVPFLMANNISAAGVIWSDVKRIPANVNSRFAYCALHAGDVLTVRVGAPGVTCVAPPEAEGLNCASLMIIRRASSFDSRWLAFVMNSPVVRSQIARVQYGAAQEQINITDAVNFQIPTPPLEEQRRIADTLEQQASRIDAASKIIAASLGSLREYRQALITAAVTGQIDVGVLASQRDDVVEPEETDG